MAKAARRAHHSKLLEVLPELRLTTVVGNAPHKDLVGFAAVAPGSFLLLRRRRVSDFWWPTPPQLSYHKILSIVL